MITPRRARCASRRGEVDRAGQIEPQGRPAARPRPAHAVGHQLLERGEARGVARVERLLERGEVGVVVAAVEELGDDGLGQPRVAERRQPLHRDQRRHERRVRRDEPDPQRRQELLGERVDVEDVLAAEHAAASW